jgi:hypothetical protein
MIVVVGIAGSSYGPDALAVAVLSSGTGASAGEGLCKAENKLR